MMSPQVVFRPLCWMIFGHQPIIEVNERENKAEYVCERCRAVLGDFVTNVRKSWTRPDEETAVPGVGILGAAGHSPTELVLR